MILPLRGAEVRETLNRLPFVRWDRLVDTPDQLNAYGWIDRPDGRHDFVVVTFVSWHPEPGYVTSSAARDDEIGRLLGFVSDERPSYSCQRIEDVLPLVRNAIRLAGGG